MPIPLSTFAILFAAIAAMTAAAAPPPVVRLSFETKANPPRYLGEGTAIDWNRPGLTLELLKRVESRAGVRFEFVRVPWARSMYLLESGQVDGVFHGSFTEERARFAAYPMKDGRPDASRSVFTQSYYLFARRGAAISWDGRRLEVPGPVGTTRGYSVVKTLRDLGARVEEENDLPNSLRKVVAGRLSAYAELENMAAAVIDARPAEFGELVRLEPPLRTVPYYLLFSKAFHARDPRLAERIWDAMAEVSRSSEFAALARQYAR